jgi:hypothetical protein
MQNFKKLADGQYPLKFEENEALMKQLKKSKLFKDNTNYSQYSKSGGQYDRKTNAKLSSKDVNQLNFDNIQ